MTDDEFDDEDPEGFEAFGSCENCGCNLYPGDDIDYCDQCLLEPPSGRRKDMTTHDELRLKRLTPESVREMARQVKHAVAPLEQLLAGHAPETLLALYAYYREHEEGAK